MCTTLHINYALNQDTTGDYGKNATNIDIAILFPVD